MQNKNHGITSISMISTAFRLHFHKLMVKVSVRLDFHADDQSSVRIVDHESWSSFYGFTLTITSVRRDVIYLQMIAMCYNNVNNVKPVYVRLIHQQ